MTIYSAFRAVGKSAGDAVNSANQFVEQHSVLVCAGLATLGVVLGPAVPAAICGALYLMKEAAAISHLHDVKPVRSPSPRFSSPQENSFTPITIGQDFRSSAPYFTPIDHLEDGDATPRPNTVICGAKTPMPAAEEEFFDALDGSAQTPLVVVAAPVASETTTSSKVKNRLEDFIARIKKTQDVGVLKQLEKLSVFDFQNSRIREKLGSKLGIDLSNINLADSSIQRIRITAQRAAMITSAV